MLILDHNMPGLEKLVKEIRKINSDSLVVFQLSHAGRLSDPIFKPPMYVYPTNGGRIMSIQDIEQTREEFVSAARRAWKVGADGVDFKQAHSFIGDDFLHPRTRGRTATEVAGKTERASSARPLLACGRR